MVGIIVGKEKKGIRKSMEMMETDFLGSRRDGKKRSASKLGKRIQEIRSKSKRN